MSSQISLKVITGPHKNRKYIFHDYLRCYAGRAKDCLVHLAGDRHDRLTSRHHCLLEIDPPYIGIKDLGSLNGTFINGKRLNKKPVNEGEKVIPTFLRSGDIITIGGSSIQVEVQEESSDLVVLDGKVKNAKGKWECVEEKTK